MSERSPNLNMPYLQPAQAQKHVTHNEALQQLDALVQITVQGFDATVPPGAPANGERHALGAGATGAWAGQDGSLASWDGIAWQFIAPGEGWQAWGIGESERRVFTGGAWSRPPVAQLGINSAASSTNRLTLASEATLLSHDGGGHQVKINKAAAGETASLLFQSGWTGHAEMGLAGDNDWRLKVSADGSSWTEALVIDRSSGLASGAAVQSTAGDTTPGRLMRADFGYGPGNLVGTVAQSGGMPSGAVMETGSNGDGAYLRWADGTQICWGVKPHGALDIQSAAGGGFGSAVITENFPQVFAAAPSVTLSVVCTSGDHDGWAALTGCTASQFSLQHLKLSPTVSQDRELHFQAVGRWY
ncbi:DUF2793 domain-containing protein [Shimia sp.]|uniref:DUF2793 domain-containing protein n=1 Tax=Shimia sp. TaxID=1954381 RepID=UPI003569A13E